MVLFNATAKLVLGASIPDEIVRVTVRGGAVTAGDVRMFDITGSDAATVLNGGLGGTDSVNVNVVQPLAAVDNFGIYCMMLEDVADDGDGWALLRGMVDYEKNWGIGGITTGVYLHAFYTTGALVSGYFYSPVAGDYVSHDTNSGAKIIAIGQNESSVASTGVEANLTYALFNGVEGFGYQI